MQGSHVTFLEGIIPLLPPAFHFSVLRNRYLKKAIQINQLEEISARWLL
jgi:hypothetical protein